MLKKDLNIIEDINKGIGDSASTGFEDIRNLNITSLPGLVSLGFKTTALSTPPVVTALAYTTDTTTNVITVASTSGWYNGMAITLATVVTSTGISTGRVYWIGDLTATTFKLYTNPSLAVGTLVDITGSNGSGTLTSYTFSAPLDWAVFYSGVGASIRPYVFILDTAGRVWWIKNTGGSLTNNLSYLGNDTLTGTGGRAIAIFSNSIVVFRESAVDKLAVSVVESASVDVDGGSGWSYGFDTVSGVSQTKRPVFVAQNDVLYFGNDTKVGSFTSAFTKTTSALDIPGDDDVESLGEIGQYLLVGGSKDKLYPWNKNTPSFDQPLKVPEYKTIKIIGTGQLAYIFAGNSGQIYVTNAVTLTPYKKLPEQVTGQQDPLITWGDALAYDNQLYFSFSATQNDGTALTTTGGVWGIDLSSKALRLVHQPSYGSYAGTTTLIIPNVLATTSIGTGLIVPWANSTTYGVDTGSTSYYTSYAAYLISPQYSVGTPLEKTALNQLEIVLEKPLAANEGVRVSYRPDRGTAFSGTTTFDYTTYSAKQYLNIDFPAVDLVTFQAKVEVTGTTTTPVLKSVIFR